MFKVRVTKTEAELIQDEILTSGSVGTQVQFQFSSDWEGLGAMAVFICGSEKYDVVLTVADLEATCIIPSEVLDTARQNLVVGVYGVKVVSSITTIAIPTIYCGLGLIYEGTTTTSANNSATPTATDVNQMLSAAQTAVTAANNATNNLIKQGVATVDSSSTGSPACDVTLEAIDTSDLTKGKKITLAFHNIKGAQGATGEKGDAAFTMAIGTVSTVSSSTPASVINVGTNAAQVWDIKIPKGEQGSQGGAGVGISSIVKTSTSGLADTYTITFTDSTTTTFTVTNGAKGDKGDDGDPGVVQSVNGKSVATVVLDGGDINLDETETTKRTIKSLITGILETLTSHATSIASKADQTGYYETLSVGRADNLIDRKGDGTSETFMFRTSAGSNSIGEDSSAIVQSVKGNTSVWNQLVNFDSINWSITNGATLTKSGSILTATATSSIVWTTRTTSSSVAVVNGHKYFVSSQIKPSVASTGCARFSSQNGSDVALTANVWNDVSAIITANTNSSGIDFYFNKNGVMVEGDTARVTNIMLIDLTQMFGSGNEPSTVAEFKALFPLDYYAYNAGTLLSFNGTGIKTVGFNQLASDGKISVLANNTYRIEGTYTSITDSEGNAVTVTNSQFTPSVNDIYTVVATTMPCIHLVWSGYRNGETEAYKTNTLSLPISTYFANGMRSAGSVYDELTPSKAITRIGSRAYQEGDENDSSVVTDKTTTYYALATPTEVAISPALTLQYDVDDFGTEQLLPINTSAPTTSAFKGIILYSRDFTRDIANMDKNMQSQASMDSLLSVLGTACGGTFTKTWDSTNSKWTYTFTPSATE